LIRLHEITRKYRTHGGMARALGPVSLEIPGGQAVAVVGPSGAGKSTLLSLLGLLDRPTGGRTDSGAWTSRSYRRPSAPRRAGTE
jgi:ABC-type lipoprotein export system ATPase subunit